MNKFKYFELTLKDGTKVTAKAPSKVTLNYALNVAYHWAKVNRNEVFNVEITK